MQRKPKASFIKEVPTQIRPRERLIDFGERALSDHELLAIILRTGTRSENVLDLSLRVLQKIESLANFKHMSIEELQSIPGIGPTKAIEMKAVMELGRRISSASLEKKGKISSSTDIGRWLIREMGHLHQEHLTAVFLTSKNEIIKRKDIFIGSVNTAVARPVEIFKEAVKYPTARIIIAHNHPSGDPEPSDADFRFTKRMIECGDLMGIELLDHIVIGEGRFISLREISNIFD